MIFSPVPLASKTTMSNTDIAENLRRIVAIVGGNAYDGVSPVSYAGSLGPDNLSPAVRIPRSLRSEPSSVSVLQVTMPVLESDGNNNSYGSVVIGPGFDLASAELVSGYFVYSELTGGATAITTTLGITVGSASPFGASVAVTSLAPATVMTLTPTTVPFTFTGSSKTSVTVQPGNVTFTGGTAPTVIGAQVGLVFKLKHVA